MKDKLAKLIDVKTIVTLVVIVVFAILALTHVIDSQNVMSIVTMVIAFYFGTQHAKKENSTAGTNENTEEKQNE